jgi:hypothetical protein
MNTDNPYRGMRNFQNLKILNMIDEDEFVGTIDQHQKGHPYHETWACYGWSKGGSFFVYSIGNGHIEKLGTLKREFVESKALHLTAQE